MISNRNSTRLGTIAGGMNKNVVDLFGRPNKGDCVADLGSQAFIGYTVEFWCPSGVQIAFTEYRICQCCNKQENGSKRLHDLLVCGDSNCVSSIAG